MWLEDLVEQHQIEEDAIKEALHYGSYSPQYAEAIGVKIIDDQSEREYNQEWTIALIFELNGKRYGYYLDGAQTVLIELTDEKTVSEWASQWDRESLPELLAATIASTD